MKAISKITKMKFISIEFIAFFILIVSDVSAQSLEKSCDLKLLKGISYKRLSPEGKSTIVQLRFAPYQLTPFHMKRFNKFKESFEKKYGVSQAHHFSYEQMICRYFFGSFSYVGLPIYIEELDKIIKECPLKELKDIHLASGPIADCAPAAVDCRGVTNNSPKHPLDKIACERVEKRSQ